MKFTAALILIFVLILSVPCMADSVKLTLMKDSVASQPKAETGFWASVWGAVSGFFNSIFGNSSDPEPADTNNDNTVQQTDNTTEPSKPDNTIQCWFTTPPNASQIHVKLIELIDSAQNSIDAHFYQINHPEIVDAFCNAARRLGGRNVRIITEEHYFHQDAYKVFIDKFESAGIEVKHDKFGGCSGSGESHNKFCVVDKRYIWSGSYNITENGSYKNNNNAFLIDNTEIAASYTQEFEEMYVSEKFGLKKTVQPRNEFGDIEVYFCPRRGARQKLIEYVNKAQSSIYIAIFTFTDSDLYNAIIEKHKQGVKVRAVFDALQANSQYSAYNYFKANGIDCYKDRNKGLLHHKFMVIDGDTSHPVLWTGSYNWTEAADSFNDENSVVFKNNRDLTALYTEEFERCYKLGKDNADEGDGGVSVYLNDKVDEIMNQPNYFSSYTLESVFAQDFKRMCYWGYELNRYSELAESDAKYAADVAYFADKTERVVKSLSADLIKYYDSSRTKKYDEMFGYFNGMKRTEYKETYAMLLDVLIEYFMNNPSDEAVYSERLGIMKRMKAVIQ